MATSGKSKRPPPLRDARMESSGSVPATLDVRRPSSQSMRAVDGSRSLADVALQVGGPLEADVARLRAERAADADDLAAMLVRVADTERARDVAVKRANGLEAWTVDLEAKVAEARTRADEIEEASSGMRGELIALKKALDASNARIADVQNELATARRDAEDALEVERVKHGLELEVIRGAQRGGSAASSGSHERSEEVAAVLDKLMKLETQTSASRIRLVEQARRALGNDRTPAVSATERATVPPPGSVPVKDAPISVAPPSQGKSAKKRSKQPPPLVQRQTTKTKIDLETFEDLDLSD